MQARIADAVEALDLTVNSRERAARTSIETLEQTMAVRDGCGDDAAQAIMAEFLDGHCRAVPDEPLPALHGRTPRQGVRSAAGHQKGVT